MAGAVVAVVPEVEVLERGDLLGVADGDGVEDLLEVAGEAVVDQLGEVLLEHGGDRERGPRRHEGRALLPDVAAVLDGLHDRGVGGRAAHAELLELGHQAGLGVAGGRLGGVAVGADLAGVEGVAGGEGRQAALLVVVAAPLLDLHPAPLGDDGAGGGELGVAARAGDGPEAHGDGLADGVDHLAGHGAAPDQLVEAGLAGLDLVADLLGPAEAVARRADGLVGLLGVGDLLAVGAGRVGHGAGAVALGGLGPGGGDGGTRQVRRVGPHVGDVALLVERLGHRHDLLGRHVAGPGRPPAGGWR